MKIFFARHGESEANVAQIISNRDLPHHLTANGRHQAWDLANLLRNSSLTRIYSSPIARAIETGGIVSRALNVECEIAEALREFDCGIYEGRGDAEAWEAHDSLARAWFDDERLNARIEGGESFVDIRDRFVSWIGSLVQAHGETDASFLLISHGGTLRCVLPILLENVTLEIVEAKGFSYTAPIEVLVENGLLFCIRWNGVQIHR